MSAQEFFKEVKAEVRKLDQKARERLIKVEPNMYELVEIYF